MKADIDRAPYKSFRFERTSLIVMAYARNVLSGRFKRRGVWGSGPSQREKFEMVLLRMAYFNRNDSKIWNIFHFLCKQEGYPPFSGWGEGPDVTLMVIFGSSREVQYVIFCTLCTVINITVLVKVLYMYMRYMC